MKLNDTFIKLWIQSKIDKLDKQIIFVDTEKEAYQIEGKLDLLKEIFEDFHLEQIDEKEIIYHSNI